MVVCFGISLWDSRCRREGRRTDWKMMRVVGVCGKDYVWGGGFF
jgi:hypothetical protein